MALPFPDDWRVDAAADMVAKVLAADPVLGPVLARFNPLRQRSTVERIARGACRAAWLNGGGEVYVKAGAVIPIPAPPVDHPYEGLRYCHQCDGERFTYYEDLAARCVDCAFATSPLEPNVPGQGRQLRRTYEERAAS